MLLAAMAIFTYTIGIGILNGADVVVSATGGCSPTCTAARSAG